MKALVCRSSALLVRHTFPRSSLTSSSKIKLITMSSTHLSKPDSSSSIIRTNKTATHNPSNMNAAQFHRQCDRHTYEDTVSALNGLQSNAAVIEEARKERSVNAYKSVMNTAVFLERIGIKISDLDTLNIIHVAGTKGKGSTCAFAESILRYSGMKTGLYSSPHLVAVCERIRINGQPLSKEKFTSYFWEVYKKLEETKHPEDPTDPGMPAYFMFLTVMAFYVFLQEKVDVAIIEVGLGGEYDCTNVIKKPVVVGVTSLGLDHVSLLGDTIDKIAWQKSGIFKPGVPAFTVRQPELALKVLKERASEIGCPLYLTPEYAAYKWHRKPATLGVSGDAQKQNASLALQLSHTWLLSHRTGASSLQVMESMKTNSVSHTFEITPEYRAGLSHCFWPGRCQVLKKGSVTYFLDGAHTTESMEHCTKWFQSENFKAAKNAWKTADECYILLFNCTGERKPEMLLPYLTSIPFDFVIFCPNRVYSVKDLSSDQSNFMVDSEKEITQCHNNKRAWCSLTQEACSNANEYPFTIFGNEIEDSYALFTCLHHALQWITQNQSPPFKRNTLPNYFPPLPPKIRAASSMKILVAGSLHLVGGVLSLVDPDLASHAVLTEISMSESVLGS